MVTRMEFVGMLDYAMLNKAMLSIFLAALLLVV